MWPLWVDATDLCCLRDLILDNDEASSDLPGAGSGVVRIDPLRFLVGCRKRRLNQALSVQSQPRFIFECVLLLTRATFSVVLFVFCVSWLLWLGFQYQ